MSDAMATLIRAKACLLAMDADGAITSLSTFENMVRSGKLRRSEVEPCTSELKNIQALAGSARDGVASAIAQVNEIINFSRNLGTYAPSGKKVEHNVVSNRNQKF